MIRDNILNYQHSIMDISTVHEDEYEHLTVNTEQRDSPAIALWITNITNSHITDIMCMKTSPATWFTTLRITNITDNHTVDISTVYEDGYEDFINTELRDSQQHRELHKPYRQPQHCPCESEDFSIIISGNRVPSSEGLTGSACKQHSARV